MQLAAYFVVQGKTSLLASGLVCSQTGKQLEEERQKRDRGQGCSNDYLTVVEPGHRGACGLPVCVGSVLVWWRGCALQLKSLGRVDLASPLGMTGGCLRHHHEHPPHFAPL